MPISLVPRISLGKMPIANGFLLPADFENEFFYDLTVGHDPINGAIGLVNTLPLEMMFHENYAYFSSTSKGMQNHFGKTAEKLSQYVKDGVVVEIGSNDGIMLEAWKNLRIKSVGVEPSKNVANESKRRGHEVIGDFFNENTVEEILGKNKVDLVFSANTFCQFKDIERQFEMIFKLIGKEGVFVFEDPYFLDIVEKTSYDQFYDEHVWYFTVTFVNNILKPYGYHVFDCEHLDVHGGELRMYVSHIDTYAQKPEVKKWLQKEANLSHKIELLERNIKKSKIELLNILNQAKKDKRKVSGFGATSKATIVYNYCGIGPDLISFVTDNTPTKQGKYYPGVHIPVLPQEEFELGKTNPNKKVDHAFLGAWNHLEEINKYQPWFKESGGSWITHIPSPRII